MGSQEDKQVIQTLQPQIADLKRLASNLAEAAQRSRDKELIWVYADLNAHREGRTAFYENEHRLKCKDGSYKWVLDRGKILSWADDGNPLRVLGTHSDITVRKKAEIENQRLVEKLQEALASVKLLSGLLPICASCKKIRDDKGDWKWIENYSHSICPACMDT